jgi:vacuolar-type H+-ATPase subunit D/Vma8
MDLLKQKRDALLIEFMSVMDETLRLSGSLQKAVSEAQYSLAVAKSVDGNVSVRSVAMATKGEVTIDMTGTGGHEGQEPGPQLVHARLLDHRRLEPHR